MPSTQSKAATKQRRVRVTNAQILERLAAIETQLVDFRERYDDHVEEVTAELQAIKAKVFNGLSLDVRLLQKELNDLLKERDRELYEGYLAELRAMREEIQKQTEQAIRQSNAAIRGNRLTAIGLILTALAALASKLLGAW